MSLHLTGLYRYPVKSCRGERLAEADVEPWGLAGDRRWMLVDPAGTAVTARQATRLVLVHPEIVDDGLRVTAPGMTPLHVATPSPAHQRPVALWTSRLTAAAAGAHADTWFSRFLGTPVHLVWLDDPARRPTSPDFGLATDRVSLADGYPLLLTTSESLAAVNDEVLASSPEPREPLPVERFRPNVVVSGAPAWAEDDWRRLRIGTVVFRAVKGCARCVLTTVDPETGERESEPVRSLARIRRIDGKTWFGVNLVPDGTGTIRPGDEVEVLEAVEPGGGPIRPAKAVARRG